MGEIRIYGSRQDVHAARSFVLDGREIALRQGSGDPSLDQNLAEAFLDILRRLDFGSGEVPAVYFMDDRNNPNALAVPAPVRPGSNGMVVLGDTLLRQMLRIGGSAVRALLAHEVSHLYQFKNRISAQAGDRVTAGRRLELQADYVAGWDLSLFLAATPRGASHARNAANAMISIASPSGAPADQATHGTQNQRFRAFMEGWIDGASGSVTKSRDAFSKGLEVAWNADRR
jgi:hypothetical protein